MSLTKFLVQANAQKCNVVKIYRQPDNLNTHAYWQGLFAGEKSNRGDLHYYVCLSISTNTIRHSSRIYLHRRMVSAPHAGTLYKPQCMNIPNLASVNH